MEKVIRSLWKNINDESPKEKKFIFGIVVGGYVSYKVVERIIIWNKRSDTKRKIKAKGEEGRLSKEKLEEFLKEKQISEENVKYIISLPFKKLQQELQEGKLKAVDVLYAYQTKALEVDKRTNCITEVIWEAEEMALSRDLQVGKKGPLHGIPISVKESHMLLGYTCTGGLGEYLNRPVTEENLLLQVLKEAGAVPFVRTNIPQGMMSFECSNPIYGVTSNPFDPTRVPGGSSGGEGALIAAGGSILGFGSDTGGSVRIPAHMCGCCGLKPTVGRLSMNGEHEFGSGQTLVRCTLGPMAANVDALVDFMKSALVPKMFDQDPDVVPLPFRNEMFEEKRKLVIGYFVDDGNLKAVPACERAVMEVRALLKAQGHTLVAFKPVDIYRMVELFVKATFADGGQGFVDILKNDQVDPTLWSAILMLKLPKWFRRLGAMVFKLFSKDRMVDVFARSFFGLKNITEYWDHATKIQDYRKEFLKKWKDNNLDALICPGFPFPAIPTGSVEHASTAITYTCLYNLLNYPAGVLTTTKVTQVDVDKLKYYPANTLTEKNVKEFCQGTVGLPCGVQFVALPFQEELVLRLMKEVETNLYPSQSI